MCVEVGGGLRDTVTLSQDARRQPWDKKLIITLQVNGRGWRGRRRGRGREEGRPTDPSPPPPPTNPLHLYTRSIMRPLRRRRETGSSVGAD